jgi:prepilin-type processing-associated H-X9-DG protein
LSLSGYAQDNDFKLPPGDTNPDRLPAASAEAFRELLEGRLEALYCRTYPLRREKLGEWEDAIARGGTWHSPCIGYLYLAGSRYDGWDVPNDNLPEGFPGANRIGSVGNDLSGTAEVVWMADFARRTTNNPADRQRPLTWDLTSHPPQRVKGKDERIGREDYRLPDGANVLFKDGHVVFRPFADLRPRLIKSGRVFYW